MFVDGKLILSVDTSRLIFYPLRPYSSLPLFYRTLFGPFAIGVGFDRLIFDDAEMVWLAMLLSFGYFLRRLFRT